MRPPETIAILMPAARIAPEPPAYSGPGSVPADGATHARCLRGASAGLISPTSSAREAPSRACREIACITPR